jgi:hypothetical protein
VIVGKIRSIRIGCRAVKQRDHRHRRLLRARRERPSPCTAEKRDELASLQSIEMHPLSLASEAA